MGMEGAHRVMHETQLSLKVYRTRPIVLSIRPNCIYGIRTEVVKRCMKHMGLYVLTGLYSEGGRHYDD